MILCDIGNTNVNFYHDGKMWSIPAGEFKGYKTSEKIYFISVNSEISESIKHKGNNFIDLEPYFEFDTIYEGIGIDRIASCLAVDDGMIVDAGSAITVDIMSSGMHLGGYILPGISAYEQCYKDISEKLNCRINPSIPLDALPQKTSDAISYGTIKPIILILQDTCKDKTIFFTGGDGKFFSKYFQKSIYDKSLIFKGMLKVIKSSNISL
ncbi:MAG: type III pantothenate kinase [Sulfurospirillaceae bacterium]|nr:type III pantothenate kinase [Sulfurospirillaceae bacterium]MDD3462385.1 type III pantothenate kinase [Sulfurospirillaceae bacterium]